MNEGYQDQYDSSTLSLPALVNADSDTFMSESTPTPSAPLTLRSSSVDKDSECSHANERPHVSDNVTILDGHFFQLVRTESTSRARVTIGKCMKCAPIKSVEIRGGGNSSSNFLMHLKRVHGTEVMNEYRRYARKVRGGKRAKTSTSTIVTQSNFEKIITEFVIHAMVPMRVVEDPYFIRMFTALSIDYPVCSRRTLERWIDELCVTNEMKIKNSLRKIAFVCTTADIWSAHKQSFFGETCHWIDSDTFERKSVALAYRQFKSPHTVEKIVELLSSIHKCYNITPSQITATVTDNVTNFTKAFQTLRVAMSNIQSEVEEQIAGEEADEFANDSDYEGEEVVDSHNTSNVMSLLPTIVVKRVLPRQLKCSSHILNLCVTADLTETISSNSYSALQTIHKKVMRKCNVLWKATVQPKSAEVIQLKLKFMPRRPNDTRWNSLYDALVDIVSAKNKINDIFVALDKIRYMFTDADFAFIDKFIQCTKPIADALDILQGEKYCYYGITTPTLLALRRKLVQHTQVDLAICRPIAKSVLQSVLTRFADSFKFDDTESRNAAIAAFSHPAFKKKWLLCVEPKYHNVLLTAFHDAVLQASNSKVNTTPSLEAIPSSSEKKWVSDFFDFGEDQTTELGNRAAIDLEILHYFNDNSEMLSMLHNYPLIKNVFIEYNTPLPSSAPVERLFSYATMTNLLKSNCLSDRKFEQRVLLKANLPFLNS